MTGDILFLCHRIPFPPDRGDKIRSYHLLHRLAEIGPVHVGCFGDDDRDMGFADDLAQVAASQCLLRRDRSKVTGRVPSHGVTASPLGPAAKGAKRPELQAPTVAWLFA